jgi:hypothetical protein
MTETFKIIYQMGIDDLEIKEMKNAGEANKEFISKENYLMNNSKRGMCILLSNMDGVLQSIIIR